MNEEEGTNEANGMNEEGGTNAANEGIAASADAHPIKRTASALADYGAAA